MNEAIKEAIKNMTGLASDCTSNGYDAPAWILATIEALNEKAERENPRPLTPEELRGMIREPVWTVGVSFNGGTWAGWDIIDGADDDGVIFGYSTEKHDWWDYDLRDPGGRLFDCAWLAYRHKPKEV